MLSTQLTRPLSRLLFGRLDARTASYRATRELIQRYFPGDYRVILPGAEVESPVTAPQGTVRILFIAGEERAALRLFLRALRALPPEPAWRATVWSPRPLTPPATLSRALRERLEFVDADQMSEAQALSRGRRGRAGLRGAATGAGHAGARAGGRRPADRLAAARLRGAARPGRVRLRVRARETRRRWPPT